MNCKLAIKDAVSNTEEKTYNNFYLLENYKSVY